MTSPTVDTVNRQVLWSRVVGLATVQGAIALMWVIYNLYLVNLLTDMGFSAALATGLLVIENLLAMVMEPLMGSLSDRLQHQMGTRFPLISLGSILAAGCFIALPIVAVTDLKTALQQVFPLMTVAWALAMTVFRSPALSLLGRYAIGTKLPQAASILTLVGGLAGAMGPLAGQMILGWGAPVAFGIGSGVLLLAAAVLWISGPNQQIETSRPSDLRLPMETVPVPWRQLPLIFGAGVGVTFGFRSLMLLFTRTANQLSEDAGGLIVGCIFVALAMTAIPAGALATRLGNRRAMVGGLALMALDCVLIGSAQHTASAIAFALLFGAAFSLVSNGTIPFALSLVPAQKAGLGTGLFFSGGAAAASLFGALLGTLRTLPNWVSVLLGMLAFLLAGVSIASAPRPLGTRHSS